MIGLLLGAALVAETAWVAPQGPGYPESIIVEADGAITLSVVFSGKIFARNANGQERVLAELPGVKPGQPGFICIVRASDGKIYATAVRERGEIWLIAEDGSAPVLVATLPAEAQPNGITAIGRHGLIVGDNVAGLWRVDIASGKGKRWLEHPLLTRNLGGQIPAANGVQASGNWIYVTNSDRALLLKIAVRRDGTPGKLVKISENVPGDDFVIDRDGTAYVTTHPHNTVLKVGAAGNPAVFAGLSDKMAGPTAAAIATVDGKRWLYVAVDGEAFAAGGTPKSPPAVVRIALPQANESKK
jgi:sugar lactone lactonase YvrE